MNVISLEKKFHILSCLVEGNSICGTERLVNVHRDTIIRFVKEIGQVCEKIHQDFMQDLSCHIIQLDEFWSFVGKKQKRVKESDTAEVGDQYIFLALDANRKAILAYSVGKRDLETTKKFCHDLKQRINTKPQITSDGFIPYVEAIEESFGVDVHYSQLVKEWPTRRELRLTRTIVTGTPNPALISTSYIERANLTARMLCSRVARKTNAFSKKLQNHIAAIAIYIVYYNFCRVHETLRTTPAMALGVTNHIWSLRELITYNDPLPPFPFVHHFFGAS